MMDVRENQRNIPLCSTILCFVVVFIISTSGWYEYRQLPQEEFKPPLRHQRHRALKSDPKSTIIKNSETIVTVASDAYQLDNTGSDNIHVLLAVCNGGSDEDITERRRYQETGYLLQSIQDNSILHESLHDQNNNVVVHIFTDDKTELSMHLEQGKYGLLPTFDYRIYEMVSIEGEDFHQFRPCASARIFAPDMFKHAGVAMPEKIIYIDSDTLVTKPLRHLWDEASEAFRQNPSLLFALAPEAYKKEGRKNVSCWYPKRESTRAVVFDPRYNLNRTIHSYPAKTCGFNSGVMFASLSRWVDQNFISMVQEQINFSAMHNLDMPYGDQGILNAMAARFPERLMTLSCHWNFRIDTVIDCLDTYVKEGGGILHGNRRIFFDKYPGYPEYSFPLLRIIREGRL